MYHKHEGVDHKIYKRIDGPLLCFRHLEKELPQLRFLLKNAQNDIIRIKEKH